jgi:hypothetical protein
MAGTAFLGFLAVMVAVVVALIARYLDRRAAFRVLVGLAVWLLYVGLMNYFGVFGNDAMRPPGPSFLLAPIVLFLCVFVIFMVRSTAGSGIALAFPLWIILSTQTFRVGVELFLHQLWMNGIVPKMLTFEGANVDIYVGASAPLVAWFSTQGRVGLGVALAWNVLGLFAVTNVVIRAVLTAPGPFNLIHAEVFNRMFDTLPFTLIPGFFVHLAVTLHILAIRGIMASYAQRENLGLTDVQASTRNL